MHILGGYLDQYHLSYIQIVSPNQTQLQNLARSWSMRCYPTLFVFILECVAVGQADGHHLGMADCLGEEWPVKLDEGDVIVASVQQFWLVTLVNDNLFNTPGIKCYR